MTTSDLEWLSEGWVRRLGGMTGWGDSEDGEGADVTPAENKA